MNAFSGIEFTKKCNGHSSIIGLIIEMKHKFLSFYWDPVERRARRPPDKLTDRT